MITQLYYKGPNKLGRLFPGQYSKEVPEMSIVLCITAVSCNLLHWATMVNLPFQLVCALDEHETGLPTLSIPFTTQRYGLVYQEILGLVQQVQKNEYHTNKFLQTRREWAITARCVTQLEYAARTFGLTTNSCL